VLTMRSTSSRLGTGAEGSFAWIALTAGFSRNPPEWNAASILYLEYENPSTYYVPSMAVKNEVAKHMSKNIEEEELELARTFIITSGSGRPFTRDMVCDKFM